MARPSRSTPKSVSTTPKKPQSTPSRSLRARVNEKSMYFEPSTDDDNASYDDDEHEPTSDSEATPTETEEDEPPRKKSKVTPKKTVTPQKSTKGRRGKKDESNEEPWETFIPNEDAPDSGDVPYENSRIHPNTLHFLKDLAKNNDREWFWSHEKRYRAAENDFKSFIEELSNKLMEVDPTIPPLPLKDVVSSYEGKYLMKLFRIYRDVRFSNDKTLYKDHMSAAWSRTGRKGPYAAYYIHIQPNNRSFIAGGKWHPDVGHLARIRHTIDRRPTKFKKPLQKAQFKKFFGGEDGLLTAEDRLKTAPKGYPKDHADIELLKLKSFRVVSKFFSDKEVLSEGFLEQCGEIMKGMSEFIAMLNDICMPDDDDSSSSDEEEEEEEGDEEEEEAE